MSRIILASQSPRRKKLLQQIGMAFEIFPSDVEEVSTHKEPDFIAQDIVILKARDVAPKFQDSLIIGADTIVVHKNKIIGKPENEDQAKQFLGELSGSTHMVITGVAFVKTDKNREILAQHSFHEQTKVTFSTLEKADISMYIKTGSPLDKAGAYGIQDDLGALFVEKIEGDYYNVVGFPLNRFYRELKTFSPNLELLTAR